MGRRRFTPAAAGAVPWGDVFFPVTAAADLIGFGAHPGGLIDAVDEWARIECRVPTDFVALIDLEVVYVSVAAPASYHASFLTEYGAIDESCMNHVEGEADREITAGGINWIVAESISDLVDAGPLEALDHLGIQVNYSAVAPATNIVVLGARLTYR